MKSDTEALRRQVADLTQQLEAANEELAGAYKSLRDAGERARAMKERNDELTDDVFQLTAALMAAKKHLPDDERVAVETLLAKEDDDE